ncbi:hypothetical protein KKC22_11900 [Myxococcota bacterium]|nr:hypothetical protein [Myxococcota bacterium]
MNHTTRVTMAALSLMMAGGFSCSRGKVSPAVPADPLPRTQQSQPGPAPRDPAQELTLTTRFAHHSRRSMVGRFTNSYSNTSAVTLRLLSGGEVVITDTGESTDLVVHQTPFVCGTEKETRTWTVERTGTWTSAGTTRTLDTKISKDVCRIVKTCDNRPPENLPCDVLPANLTLTCSQGVVPVGEGKKPMQSISCTTATPGTVSYSSFPWAFGQGACLERVTSAHGPFHYEFCEEKLR